MDERILACVEIKFKDTLGVAEYQRISMHTFFLLEMVVHANSTLAEYVYFSDLQVLVEFVAESMDAITSSLFENK